MRLCTTKADAWRSVFELAFVLAALGMVWSLLYLLAVIALGV
jgi:hypothetical protein